MSRSRVLFTLICFLSFVVFNVAKAHALEKLNYNNQTISKSVVTQVEQHLSIPRESLDIAQANLNNDGIPEIFVRETTCKKPELECFHYILAQKTNGLITIDTIKAKDIALGNEQISGVRNLLVFKNVLNDFDYDVYTWAAKEKRFVHKE